MPRDDEGKPDFRYVATHIGDSIKRRLKANGATGLQGEFGIGLLSFCTIGDELIMTSTGADQRAFREAIMTFPIEEYDWFDIQSRALRPKPGVSRDAALPAGGAIGDDALLGVSEPEPQREMQRQFFEFAGRLFSVAISPVSSVVRVGESRKFQALSRD